MYGLEILIKQNDLFKVSNVRTIVATSLLTWTWKGNRFATGRLNSIRHRSCEQNIEHFITRAISSNQLSISVRLSMTVNFGEIIRNLAQHNVAHDTENT